MKANEIKENVYFALINYEANRDLLKEIPHERILDLAVVLYVSMNTGKRYSHSMLISAPLLKKLKVDFNELYNIAKKNAMEKRPVQLLNLTEIFGKRGFLKETIAVTNSAYRFGAACILYPGMLKSIAGERWEKLLILPCSIHEISVVPYVSKEEADWLKECVAKIGEMDRENNDFLSESLYVYDALKDEIFIYE